MNSPVYLDYNASTPMTPAVKAAVSAAQDSCGSPSSVHAAGRNCRQMVEDARRHVAQMVGAAPEQVIFTSGATESNNTILKGTAADRIIVSTIEHASVLKSAPDAAHIPVAPDGVVDLEKLEDALKSGTGKALVSIMMVNNETGVIQPVENISALCKKYDAWFHSDIVQATGRLPTDMTALGIDMASLSAHKLAGPQGVGASIVPEDIPIAPLLHGGRQEKMKRAGHGNFLGIVGFGAAAKAAIDGLADYKDLAPLRDKIESHIMAQTPAAHIFGKEAPRVANTSAIALPGVSSETQLMTLDLAGFCVSGGSACASGAVAPSHVAIAMGATEELATCAIRISLGWQTTEDDIDNFLNAWDDMLARVQDKITTAAE